MPKWLSEMFEQLTPDERAEIERFQTDLAAAVAKALRAGQGVGAPALAADPAEAVQTPEFGMPLGC